MSSYVIKTTIGNEVDKFIKELTGGESVDEETEDTGISAEDVLAHQKKQKAVEKERKLRQAKVQKEREEARQKIRDKYNIKKTDDLSTPAHSKTTKITTLNENQASEVHQTSSVENQDTTHQQIDEYSRSRTEQISREVAAANSRIVADTQKEYKLKMQQFVEEFDVSKASNLVTLGKDLNLRQEMILDAAKIRIDDLNEKANRLK
ncbi:unnamed protein product [Rotaria magnacalcarata]|uniref:Uncharacterized protein n=1 Tax=Rotaria magnacalcarata TaxID=392030 RepID=A0A819DA52_9BILA|nr:unnamed protein product [Rotaria magnacalcarata]CAF3832150.1 unnamed protein product [Rotaria magnacalcarata]